MGEEEEEKGRSSPLLHPLLERREQKLLMEAVDGADVGEDSLDHITGEGGARAGLLQEPGTENLQREQTEVTASRC